MPTTWTEITTSSTDWLEAIIEAYLCTTDGLRLQTTDGLNLVIAVGTSWDEESTPATTWNEI